MSYLSHALPIAFLLGWPLAAVAAQTARISEDVRVLTTYPFSEPNPVPILTRDPRLYPYHSFEGYARAGTPREWKVVRLENDYIEVFVLPEVGGKVWGAVVKKTGHEFIYRNEVMKFRNIALRGPWTSGGIEFNFGVIGHTPATATPVDYVLRENPDGSVSCFVGAMDLPSRTQWRVEIRLPADRAYFETNVLWYNPTPLEHPYYNWMTAAAFARDDLELAVPGDAYLEHSGQVRPWPVDSAGRVLDRYDDNRFAGHKSYHVVGELDDFFGGYYGDDDYGFGHWSRYEDMPGQKIWLWALSRQGGVWEELLTDTDGQYIEFQAGRLFVQYSPAAAVNPVTQAGFDPGATDRWSETWFPVEGLGGLTDASRDAAMYVTRAGNELTVRLHAFRPGTDTLRVVADRVERAAIPLALAPLEPMVHTIDITDAESYHVRVPGVGLDYVSDRSARALSRPFTTDPVVREQIPPADRAAFAGRELARARRYAAARERYEAAVALEPWHREARLGLADLEFRRARYDAGLPHVNRVLQLDAYDAAANFNAGNLYRALGREADARDAFAWAARATSHRSTAYVQLAEIMLGRGDLSEAARLATLATDADRHSVPALEILAIVARLEGRATDATALRDRLLAIDPLHHFAAAERYLSDGGAHTSNALAGALRSEYPDQTLLELAIGYHRRGRTQDALAVLHLDADVAQRPVPRAWRAWLADDPRLLAGGADVAFAFPYRRETIPVLLWAVEHTDHWSWSYLAALNLWARDRADEAGAILADLGDRPDFAPAYVARSVLLAGTTGRNPEPDLRRAVRLDRENRILRIHLVRHLQDRGRWHEALRASTVGRELFPDDFNLDLLHVESLNNLGRPSEAVAILEAVEVLPSENARGSHRLYVEAHTTAALDALESGDADVARRHLERALLWPERLGQGKPYAPEERLVRYLMGRAASLAGDAAAARGFYEAVAATTLRAGVSTRLDVLAIASLVELGREDETPDVPDRAAGTIGAMLARATEVARRGAADPALIAAALRADHAASFDDLAGRSILRALSLAQ